ncbi:MAG: erythromycin esterase family protein [Chryseolinea sp.]
MLKDPYWQQELSRPIGHRAIGVVYNPANERGNYVPSIVARRYDALIYIEKTKALHPLGTSADQNKTPETFPFGL